MFLSTYGCTWKGLLLDFVINGLVLLHSVLVLVKQSEKEHVVGVQMRSNYM